MNTFTMRRPHYRRASVWPAILTMAAAVIVGCGSGTAARDGDVAMASALASSPPRQQPAVKPTLGVTMDSSHKATLVSLPTSESLAAWGGYVDTIDTDGWSYLSVTSNETLSDDVQAYAAGYVEAALTHERIWEFAHNKEGDSVGWSSELAAFVARNIAYVQAQVADAAAGRQPAAEHASWWHQVGLMMTQHEGLHDGYLATCGAGKTLSDAMLLTLSLHSDMDTLCPLFGCTDYVMGNYSRPRVSLRGHCSVIVKLVEGDAPSGSSGGVTSTTELYTAHTTWTGFEDMTRVYKRYDLGYHGVGASSADVVPGRVISFSSYPGNLFSTDDWYITSAGLVVTETTIDNHNSSLWQFVQPHTVMTWIRTQVANRLGTSGATWAAAFGMQNSGTYNNEMHVVDHNRFADYQRARADAKGERVAMPAGVLTILDQMPGHVEVVDRTPWLQEKTFWSSYNRPGLPATYELANYTATVAALGDHYSWEKTSRAVLFRELQGNITDEASLRRAMRWNRFDTDARGTAWQGCTSGPSASNAISERGDLTPTASGCIADIARQNEGAIDLKYTTAAMMQQQRVTAGEVPVGGAIAVSGPTNDDQPDFVWSKSPFASTPHLGQPDAWSFPWVLVNWE